MGHISDDAIANYGAGVLGLGIVALAIIYAVRGRVRLAAGRAKMTVPRWTVFERVVHWYAATLFVALALTGLGLMFSRSAATAASAESAFQAWNGWVLSIHTWLGPAFSLGVLLMIVRWLGINVPARHDWESFKHGAGLVGGKIPAAGKVTAGDKLFVYWVGLVVVGTTVCATGLMLAFPDYAPSMETVRPGLLHLIGALLWIVIILGHSYLGTFGVEGALEGMAHGRVDVNFARQNHELWAEELMQLGIAPQSSASPDESGDDR